MHKKFLYSSAIAIIFLGSVVWYTQSHRVQKIDTHIPQVTIGGHTFVVTLAKTADEHERGLSGKKSMSQNEGMLFVFENNGLYSFWMKDMLFPLDIVWIDENNKIVHVEENLLPQTYPKSFISKELAKYVLELNGGIVRKNSIRVGDKVRFSKIN